MSVQGNAGSRQVSFRHGDVEAVEISVLLGGIGMRCAS